MTLRPVHGGGDGRGGGGVDFPDLDLPKNLLGWLFGALLVAVGGLGVASSFYTVGPDEEAVVLRLGKLHTVAGPGFHARLPYFIDRIQKVPVRRVHKEEFGFRTIRAGARTEYSQQDFTDESIMLSGDLNIADVEWIVQYRIAEPTAWWFHISEPEQTVRDVAESVVRQVVGNRTVDEVLTVGRSAIEVEAAARMQEILTAYESGLKVVALQLQNVTPPGPVQASFNDVNRAEQDREKLENEALARLNREIPNARGEAQRAIDRAEGYRTNRVNTAEGDAARFTSILEEYRKAPEVTRRRIHLEALARVLPAVSDITVLDKAAAGAGALPLLDLREPRRGGTP